MILDVLSVDSVDGRLVVKRVPAKDWPEARARIPTDDCFYDGSAWVDGKRAGPAPEWAKKAPLTGFVRAVGPDHYCHFMSSTDGDNFGSMPCHVMGWIKFNVTHCFMCVAPGHRFCGDHGGKTIEFA